MTPILCRACGKALKGPEMSGPRMGHLLGHIQDTHAVPALHALSRFIEDAYPADEATPRLTAVIATNWRGWWGRTEGELVASVRCQEIRRDVQPQRAVRPPRAVVPRAATQRRRSLEGRHSESSDVLSPKSTTCRTSMLHSLASHCANDGGNCASIQMARDRFVVASAARTPYAATFG